MPVLIHGVTGSVYRYSTRRNSAVHIENQQGVPVRGGGRIHLSLRIPREILEVFIEAPATVRKDPLWEIADEIDHTLAGLLSRKPKHRKPTLSLPFSRPLLLPAYHITKSFLENTRPPLEIGTRRARIIVNRKELPLIEKWLRQPPPPGWDRKAILLWFFLDRTYLKIALKPARGQNVANQLFRHYLPSAYFTCSELVKLAYESEDLDRRIEEIMTELRKTDKRAKMLLQGTKRLSDKHKDRTETVCLVYWGFHGAWKRYRLEGLLRPLDALRQYLYGRERRFLTWLHETFKRELPDLYYMDGVFEWSKKLYLGKRGAAAKALHLLD